MKNKIFALMALLSFNASALIQSPNQLFFGQGKQVDSCGVEGRLLITEEIMNQIGHKVLCRTVRSPWAIWKIQNTDGTEWSFMGTGYNCQMKPGVNPVAQSICVMKDEPSANKAFIFKATDYRGEQPWQGNALIKELGDEVNDAEIVSFKLGESVQLVAYPEVNFGGVPTIYSENVPKLETSVKSYKIQALQIDNDITFDFTANTPNKVCLKLHPASGINNIVEVCSTDLVTTDLVLTQIQETESLVNVAVYLEDYTDDGIVTTIGVFYLAFTGQGDFTLQYVNLPPYLSVVKSGHNLSFTYE